MRIFFAILLSFIVYNNVWGQNYPMAVFGDVYIDTNGKVKSLGAVHLKAPSNDLIAKVANYGSLGADTIIFHANDSIEGLLMNRSLDAVLGTTPNVIVRKTITKNNEWYPVSFPFAINPNGGVKTPLSGSPFAKGVQFEIQYYDTKVRAEVGKHDDTAWQLLPADSIMKRGKAHRVAVKLSGAGSDTIVDFIADKTVANNISHLFAYQVKGSDLKYETAPYYTNPQNSEGWNAIGGLYTTNYTVTASGTATIQYAGALYYWRDDLKLWTAVYPAATTGTLRPYGVVYVQTPNAANLIYNNNPSAPSGGFIFVNVNNGLTFGRQPQPYVFRSAQDAGYDLLELQLSDSGESNYASPVYFRFGDAYSRSFVKIEDHIQLQTEHERAPILWSLAKYENSEDNNVLFVNSLPYGTHEVALGVNAPLTGEYIFSLKEYTNETIVSVILWDKATNEKVELLKNDYHFQSDGKMNTDKRFVLFFNQATSIDPIRAAEVYAYTENNRLTVKNLLPGDAVQIVDIAGRTIASGTAVGDSFSAALNQKGVYVVKVRGEKIFKVLNQ